MNVPLFRKALIPLLCPHKHPLSVGTKSINKPVLKTYSAKRRKTIFGCESSALRQRRKDCVRCCRGVCSTGFNGLVGRQCLWVICKVKGIRVGAGARFAEFDGFFPGARGQANGRVRNAAATTRWQQLQEAGADWVGNKVSCSHSLHPTGRDPPSDSGNSQTHNIWHWTSVIESSFLITHIHIPGEEDSKHRVVPHRAAPRCVNKRTAEGRLCSNKGERWPSVPAKDLICLNNSTGCGELKPIRLTMGRVQLVQPIGKLVNRGPFPLGEGQSSEGRTHG